MDVGLNFDNMFTWFFYWVDQFSVVIGVIVGAAIALTVIDILLGIVAARVEA